MMTGIGAKGRPGYDRLVELHKLAETDAGGVAGEFYEAACAAYREPSTVCRSKSEERKMSMYVAMNRFRVRKGHEAEFENVWKNRDSRLTEVPGFRSFHLLRGDYDEESATTLYSSHTVWQTRDAFVDWTKSEHFRAAHKNAGDNRGMYDGHPRFEGFEAVLGE